MKCKLKKIELNSLIFLISLSLYLPACTAMQATVNAIGRNITSAFRAPGKVENKITDPFRPDARLAVLWIGHASVLIQIDDKFILTDPVLTTTVGQFSKRLVEAGIDVENIPGIDALLVTHLHIDHYSPASIAMLENRISQMLIPQGALVYVPDFSFSIDELAEGDIWQRDGLKITAVPVVHNGWRYGLDYSWMTDSFTGYLVEYNGIRVFISGDTAYDSLLFKETGQRFAGIDLALLPIAPIHPRTYSRVRHTDPAEALQITQDLGAEFLIPIHYDTFPESFDSPGEAAAKLREETRRRQFNPAHVAILRIGELRVLISKSGKEMIAGEKQ